MFYWPDIMIKSITKGNKLQTSTIRVTEHYSNLFSNSLQSNKNNLIYFLKQLGNKEKRECSAITAVFSCNVLRGNTLKIFLS